MRAEGVEKAQKGYCMLGSLGHDKDFLGHDKASGSMSRHGSQIACCCRVATRVFLVVTVVFLLFFCCDRISRSCVAIGYSMS